MRFLQLFFFLIICSNISIALIDQSVTNISSPNDITLLRKNIATRVENLEPYQVGRVFTTDVKRVYCFNDLSISNSSKNIKIKHEWIKDNTPIYSIYLTVKGPRFRTYSYKTIRDSKEYVGSWKVNIYKVLEADNGNKKESSTLIDTVKFKIVEKK